MTQTQSKFPCLILFVLMLYSMEIFEINTQVLIDSANDLSNEFGLHDEDVVAPFAGLINQVMIPALFVISGLIFLSDGAARKLLVKKPALPLFILLTSLVFMASISVSDVTRFTIVRSGSQLLFLSTLAALIYSIHDKKFLYLTAGLAFLTALVIDLSLYFLLDTGFASDGQFAGYHRNPNMAGNQYGVATMIFIFLAITRKNPLFLIACLASVVLLIFSDSRTSMGSIGIFLLLSLVYRVPIARAIVILSVLIGAVGISVYFSLGGNDPESFTGRGEIWNFLSQHVWAKPFLGHGFSSFWDIGAQSLNVTTRDDFISSLNTGHNGFIDVMAGTGLVGLVLFVGFLFLAALLLARLDSRYFIAHYLFIAFLISNVTESYFFYYQNIMWLAVILMIGAAYTDSQQSSRRRRRRVQS